MGERAPEQELAELLPQRRLTIATAESCTGGLVAHRITALAGSSAYFVGGIVSYSNALKESLLNVPRDVLERYGAVSRECALAMAHGVRVRTGADIGVSTTGIAGPGGATPSKPVGLVYVACATPSGDVCEEYRWGEDRSGNIARTAEVALRLAVRLTRGEPGARASDAP